MNPEEQEFAELEFGKVFVEPHPLDKLIAPLTMLQKYHDFLGRIPWARSDN